MPTSPKILAFAGSTREESFNKKLIRIAASHLTAVGADVSLIDLRDFPMPLYDGDLESKDGLPEHALRLKELMKSHDGFFVSCPEYNGSITGVLKNAIDWASRSAPGEKALECFVGKTGALVSASPGAFGASRSLVATHAILAKIQVLVIGESLSLPRAHEAFDGEGRLKDPKVDGNVQKIASRLVEVTAKMRA